ncbi:MAG: type II toxin-antitoxin system HicA family toxin [bacterium]|nr:type II toxin-antitoxin system HicA family toxin [bacterium]
MLKNLKAKEILTIFRSFGFETVGQKGSHIKLRRISASGKQTLLIPNHDPIAKGTLKEIFKQATSYIGKDELFLHFFN